MSVNCYLVLPPTTHVDDVLNALGALAGNVSTEKPFNGFQGGTYLDWSPRKKANGKQARVPHFATPYKGMSPDHTFMNIPTWNDPTSGYDDGLEHEALYSFENDYEIGEPGDRNFYVKSTAWWIAACFRLAQMFGGKVVANDCTDRITFEVPYKKSGFAAIVKAFREDDPRLVHEGWNARQSMTFLAMPLTEAELKKANRYAAYKMGD